MVTAREERLSLVLDSEWRYPNRHQILDCFNYFVGGLLSDLPPMAWFRDVLLVIDWRLFNVIDDDQVKWDLFAFEPEAELLLNRRQKGRAGIAVGRSDRWPSPSASSRWRSR